MKQKLIVIEGLDGSGKATQAQMLSSALQEQGFQVHAVPFSDHDSPSAALMKPLARIGTMGTRLLPHSMPWIADRNGCLALPCRLKPSSAAFLRVNPGAMDERDGMQ